MIHSPLSKLGDVAFLERRVHERFEQSFELGMPAVLHHSPPINESEAEQGLRGDEMVCILEGRFSAALA